MNRTSILIRWIVSLGAGAFALLWILLGPKDIKTGNIHTDAVLPAQQSANTASAFAEEQLRLGKKPNRLINEKSPYLLQHAFNPVDWYPWGEEAFDKARDEDKPIFLSIGYSTCYWCHVMEREVFEDTAIARLMNERLICIKVDREERPDVDRVYMAAVQVISGSGGWPMSVFMTADRKPFFAGTYIPPRAQYGRMGFPDLVSRIDTLWKNDREKLISSSQEITDLLQTPPAADSTLQLNQGILDAGFHQLARYFDHDDAGFGAGPKFPRPVVYNFLLRYFARTGNDSALQMTLATLHAMARGGMYDHIGGGFHRYSVDGKWRVPHFEKMLYDQAQLVTSYLEAYQITHDEAFAATARDVLSYVTQKLRSPEGGFYSAEDAESALDFAHPEEKEEGTFYLWTKREIDATIKPEAAAVFHYVYGVEDGGNALQDPQGVFAGKNILYQAHTAGEAASKFHMRPEEIRKVLEESREQLFNAREKRPHPHLDDKIITAWNGMMISAFAKAYQVLHDENYLAAAREAADFVYAHLYDPSVRRLKRRYRDNEARFEGGLEDYACLAMGFIDLYEASFDLKWLDRAVELTEVQNQLFRDDKRGGFFDITGDDPTILVRTREEYDGAEPSGNSVAAMNLLRLAQLTDRNAWKALAERAIMSSAMLPRSPEAAPQMLAALAWDLSIPKEIVIAGSPAGADTRALLGEVHRRFIPFKAVALQPEGAGNAGIAKYLSFTNGMAPMGGKAAAYICENYACRLPTTDPAVVGKLLDELTKAHKTGSPP